MDGVSTTGGHHSVGHTIYTPDPGGSARIPNEVLDLMLCGVRWAVASLLLFARLPHHLVEDFFLWFNNDQVLDRV